MSESDGEPKAEEEPDQIIDDNSEMVPTSTKKHEMVLNMKAIGNYNDLKYRKMPAKRIKGLFS